jgi:DNA (cytosine-5)-methyltransferase 1
MKNEKQMEVVKVVDLFAGLGGIRLGFQQGMESVGLHTACVFASEVKEYAIKAYQGYYGDEKIYGDITQISANDIPDFDFLLAGFPCQPFSSAGKGLGFADTRGTLFFEIERILKNKIDKGKPAMGFLLENVEGLVNHDGGNTLNIMLRHLETLGYKVTYKLLDSQYFGVAQSRKRVYIVGTLDRKIDLNNFEISTATLGDILEHGLPVIDSSFTRKLFSNYKTEELIGKSIKDKRGGKDNIHSWDFDLKGKTTARERKLLNTLLKERRKKKWAEEIGITWMDGMPLTEQQIRTFYDVPNLTQMLTDLEQKGYLTYEHPKELKNGKRIPDESKPRGYNIVAGKLSFEFSKILNPHELSPTLVAMDVSKLGVIDGDGLRKLTIREGQRLCGYPENYDLSMLKEKEAFDLLGNTVCVPVIRAIAERIGQYCIERRKI